jgi:sugar phosphate isomerase/epimerase
MQFVMFSKMLQSLSVAEAGRTIRELGFDGVDLTVRPGGHVEPSEVATALPEAVRRLQDEGLTVPMITTAIVSHEEPHAAAIFETAASCGIPRLKLGYWQYRGFGSIRALIHEARRALDGIESLAGRTGVQGCLHNHSGDYLTANAAVTAQFLEDRDPKRMGAYVDPGHLTIEGGVSGWKIGLDLLSPWISLLAAKSLGWERSEDPETREVRWRSKMVPLREGTVRWREVFALLREISFDGTVSVHSEYQGGHSWRNLSVPELIEQTREDLAYLRDASGVRGRS